MSGLSGAASASRPVGGPEVPVPGASPAAGSPPVAVEAVELRKLFGSFAAVDGVSFEVRAGSVFGLLGANGAGKSTTIRMLCGLLPPSSGRARVAGVDVARDPEGVKRSIGYMSQRFSLYEDLSPRENIQFYAGLYGVPRSRVASETERVLDLTGLSGRGDELVRGLSAGFRQRLALGCAVLHAPGVVFLDEPTAGVDPSARRRFWDVIYGLAAAGTAIVVTTHYLDEAEYCDEVVLMHAGRVASGGSPRELKTRTFAGPFLEVECDDPDAALRALGDLRGLEEAAIFGTRIHAAFGPGASENDALADVESRLGACGAGFRSARLVPPSLEDVFIRVVSRKGEP